MTDTTNQTLSQNQTPTVNPSPSDNIQEMPTIPEIIDDITNTKPFWKSKTFWIVIIAIVTALINAYGTQIPTWLYAILGALGLISLRVGDKTLTKN